MIFFKLYKKFFFFFFTETVKLHIWKGCHFVIAECAYNLYNFPVILDCGKVIRALVKQYITATCAEVLFLKITSGKKKRKEKKKNRPKVYVTFVPY